MGQCARGFEQILHCPWYSLSDGSCLEHKIRFARSRLFLLKLTWPANAGDPSQFLCGLGQVQDVAQCAEVDHST